MILFSVFFSSLFFIWKSKTLFFRAIFMCMSVSFASFHRDDLLGGKKLFLLLSLFSFIETKRYFYTSKSSQQSPKLIDGKNATFGLIQRFRERCLKFSEKTKNDRQKKKNMNDYRNRSSHTVKWDGDYYKKICVGIWKNEEWSWKYVVEVNFIHVPIFSFEFATIRI